MNSETWLAPAMKTLPRGFVVKQPEGDLAEPIVGPEGGVSVGPMHIKGIGAAVAIALHDGDGQTLVAVMGGAGFHAFAMLVKEAGDRALSGEFDTPPVQQ